MSPDPHSPLAHLAGWQGRCPVCGFLHLDGRCAWSCDQCPPVGSNASAPTTPAAGVSNTAPAAQGG